MRTFEDENVLKEKHEGERFLIVITELFTQNLIFTHMYLSKCGLILVLHTLKGTNTIN